jgi:hypothetical protein
VDLGFKVYVVRNRHVKEIPQNDEESNSNTFFLYDHHISNTYEFVPKKNGDFIFPNLQWIYLI